MTKLSFKEKGAGDVIVLIHGFCESKEIWDPLTADLATTHRILCVDLPGCGESPAAREVFSIADVAGVVMDWLDGLGIHGAVLIGHSMGGYVTLAVAHEAPAWLKGIGLYHSTALADSPEKRANRDRVVSFVNDHGVAPFVQSFVPTLFTDKTQPGVRQAVKLAEDTRPETLIGYTKAMRDRPDRQHVLASFETRLLFVAGAQDPVVPMADVLRQTRDLKQAEVHVLPNAAHMGMFEAPGDSIRLIRNFARKCSSVARPGG